MAQFHRNKEIDVRQLQAATANPRYTQSRMARGFQTRETQMHDWMSISDNAAVTHNDAPDAIDEARWFAGHQNIKTGVDTDYGFMTMIVSNILFSQQLE